MKAIVVGINLKGEYFDLDYSLHELKSLAETLDYEIVYNIRQAKDKPDKATFIGKGKVLELKELCQKYNADIVIFDDVLTPVQNRNLEEILQVKVIDRTYLILEIFAKRAKTKEAKLEIALAKDRYLMSRIGLLREEESRSGGASGSLSNKGSGETQQELDRRHLSEEIVRLEQNLKEIRERKLNQIERRKKNSIPIVSLVGYTNAGKSSTMNSLITYLSQNDNKKVLEKDCLFATLDTYSRKLCINNLNFILTDTIGFISKLPTTLVYSFYYTLEEVKNSDLIIYVIDISSPYALVEFEITYKVLEQIGASNIPFIVAFTKIDKLTDNKTTLPPQILGFMSRNIKENISYKEYRFTFINNKEKIGINNLAEAIFNELSLNYMHLNLNVPYSDGKTINLIEEHAQIISKTYLADYILYDIMTDEKYYPLYAKYENGIQVIN